MQQLYKYVQDSNKGLLVEITEKIKKSLTD